jgi:DNA-3-methyladenine glycosylase
VTGAHTLRRSFYDRDALTVAPELLNKLLVHGDVSARLVEVEAYTGRDDPGSHAYRGETPRNATMFRRPGSLYVYLSYGMHWCANAVCGPGTTPHAVLLRAAEPVAGLDVMRVRRTRARRDVELARGPGSLGRAFGFDRSLDGTDLTRGPVRILDDGIPPPDRPGVSTRVGLGAGKGDTFPYRFYVPGDPHVSRATAAPTETGRGSSRRRAPSPPDDAPRGSGAHRRSPRR